VVYYFIADCGPYCRMFIEVHYDGVFKKVGKRKKYVGGKMHLRKDFSTDEWSWFEMRYHFK